jgi:hypothetical protein
MKEIQDLIITILEKAPHLAIWILVIIYGYKVVVVGSIFGLIKYICSRIIGCIENREKKPIIYQVDSTKMTAIGRSAAEELMRQIYNHKTTENTYLQGEDFRHVIDYVVNKKYDNK